MRGVAGLGFIFLGLVMGYLILSGKFPGPSSYLSQFPQAQVTTVPAGKASSSALNAVITSQGNVEQPARHGDGGNSMGLPTVKHLQDVNASQGGMR